MRPGLPLTDLEQRLVARLGRAGVRVRNGDSSDPCLAAAHELAELVGVTPRTWCRYREQGTVPASKADTLAVRAGYHPLEIWPDFHQRVAP